MLVLKDGFFNLVCGVFIPQIFSRNSFYYTVFGAVTIFDSFIFKLLFTKRVITTNILLDQCY